MGYCRLPRCCCCATEYTYVCVMCIYCTFDTLLTQCFFSVLQVLLVSLFFPSIFLSSSCTLHAYYIIIHRHGTHMIGTHTHMYMYIVYSTRHSSTFTFEITYSWIHWTGERGICRVRKGDPVKSGDWRNEVHAKWKLESSERTTHTKKAKRLKR